METQNKPIHLVAIIGRPNVGKSTMFNRLVGERRAILDDNPGTTRDVLFGTVAWNKASFTVADTAGLEPDLESDMNRDILLQTRAALDSADLIFFMVNAAEGLLPDDKVAAEMIRRSGKPTVLLVNKTDTNIGKENLHEFHALGFANQFETSGTSGKGLGDLLDETVKLLAALPPTGNAHASDLPLIKVAILGRPNVGKSTMFNKLLDKKRSIVSDIAGTTRDAINEIIEYEDFAIELVDTAGLRRRGKVQWGVEKFSSLRMVKAIQQADLCLLVMESDEGVIAQDMHIMQMILEADRSPIIIINKWDLIEKTPSITADYERIIQARYKFATWIPMLFVSALTGQRVAKIKDLVIKVWKTRNTTLPEAELHAIIKKAILNRPPSGRRVDPKITAFRQTATNPPLVQLTVNRPEAIHFTYLRYLDNQIRKSYPLSGTPIQFNLKASSPKSKAD